MDKNVKPVKLYAYCRVSTIRQKDKDTIQNQHQSINAFAAANGIQIVEWFDEKALSGANPERPRFKELRERLKNSPDIAGVVVYDVSRLVRDEDLGEDTMRDFRDNKKLMYQSLTGTYYDFSDSGQRFQYKVFNWFASEERMRSKARQREGIIRAHEKGVHLGKPFKTINWAMYDEMKAANLKDAQCARMLKVDQHTLARRVADRNAGHPEGISKPKRGKEISQ